MLCCELLARYLADADPGSQFGVVGEGNLGVVTALAALGVPYVPARREDAAVGMADGWARRSGRLGLASVTSGPGLTNALTSLVEAVRHGTPLVLVASLVPAAAAHHPQQLAARELVVATGAAWRELADPAALARDVAAVVREARLHRRPQVLAVPQELLYVAVDDLLLADALPGALPTSVGLPAPASAPDPAAVDRAATALRASRRPVVVAGRGVVEAGGEHAVAALARHLGAPLATTLLGRGLFADDRAHVGIFGGLSSAHGGDVLPTADLVLALGCSLNPWTTMQGALLDGVTLVHADADPAALGRWHEPDVGVVGDAREVASALLAELGDDEPRSPWAPSTPTVPVEDAPAPGGGLRTGEVAAALAARLPVPVTIALDSGHAVLDALPHLPVASPGRLVFAVHAGAVGQGLGTAIGAALAAGDEWTVLVIGDGALSMSLQELDTARQQRLRLLVVVLDDGGYGAEVHYAGAHGIPATHAHTDNPDYVAVARSLGFTAHRVDRLADLDVVAGVLDGPPGPALLHVPVSATPMSRWYRAFTAGVTPVTWTAGA